MSAFTRFCFNAVRISRNILEPKRISQNYFIKTNQPVKNFSVGSLLKCEKESESNIENKAADEKSTDPAINRYIRIPVETSIQYLESEAYIQTYGENPVWTEYRRNFKGQFAPKKTRKTCIRGGKISTGNPCPICRDEYLVLDYRNLKLLKQFICPHTGSILSYSKTGLCQHKHQDLVIAIERAKEVGYIIYDVPFRHYNYSEYQQQ